LVEGGTFPGIDLTTVLLGKRRDEAAGKPAETLRQR